jgi:phosphate/sulfate permease
VGKTELWSYDGSGDILLRLARNEDFRMAINEIGAETRIRSGNGCGARSGRSECSRYASKHHACSRLCRWSEVGKMVTAWVITIPIAAAIGGAVYWVVELGL